MSVRTLDDADLKGKRVLVRVDLNVPMENGRVTDATRIERVLPTIREIADKGGKVVLLAHFGRPKGRDVEAVAEADRCSPFGRPRASGRLRRGLHRRSGGEGRRGHEGRRHPAPREHPLPRRRGEERPGFREGAGEARRRLRQRRLLGRASRARLDRGPRPPAPGLCRPRHAGGARGARRRASRRRRARSSRSSAAPRSRPRSTSSRTSSRRSTRSSSAAAWRTPSCSAIDIGDRPLARRAGPRPRRRSGSWTGRARRTAPSSCRSTSWSPSELKADAPHHTYGIDAIPADGMILDIGAQSVDRVNAAINDAATLVWNGPLGAFEHAPFDQGTVAAARHAAERTAAGQARLGRRRRRHGRGAEPRRRRGRFHLRLDRRRRLPRMARRQAAAGRGGAAETVNTQLCPSI